MVKSPAVSEQHPDRALECERAMEPGFEALADLAELSGWREGEVNDALLRLALARILASDGNANTDETIRRAWLAVRGDDQAGM
jgi:hypothetical protein